MRFVIWPDNTQAWPDVLDLVQYCDSTGWDGAYFADHFMSKDSGSLGGSPVLECWTTLAALASVTKNISLGCLVTAITYRHPAIIAKAATTVDQISNGRFTLGLGTGWQVNEHQAYGLDLPAPGPRLDRLGEGCEVIRSLLSEDFTTFRGRYYNLHDARCAPKPVRGAIPLLIGGTGDRLISIAARYANIWNGWCTVAQFSEKSRSLRYWCNVIVRDYSTITRSTQAYLYLSDDQSWITAKKGEPSGRPRLIGSPAEIIDQIANYKELGLSELVIPDRTLGTGSQKKDLCSRFISEIASVFRSV
jgi:alkanesulfonate monooxygenase SsuD/methylene tetrahydromethanopterin reductase-like flavin-dependent oxidoreductase (luciferase family)